MQNIKCLNFVLDDYSHLHVIIVYYISRRTQPNKNVTEKYVSSQKTFMTYMASSKSQFTKLDKFEWSRCPVLGLHENMTWAQNPQYSHI